MNQVTLPEQATDLSIDATVGDVRQDPESKSVAVRRDVTDDDPQRWAVMTLNSGGHYGYDSEVQTWLPMSTA